MQKTHLHQHCKNLLNILQYALHVRVVSFSFIGSGDKYEGFQLLIFPKGIFLIVSLNLLAFLKVTMPDNDI